MIKKRVTRYYSDCRKGFWNKQSCLNHEENCKCWTNPKNKTCKTCVHSNFIPYEGDTGDGAYFECQAINPVEWHAGAPDGVDHLSVNCKQHTLKDGGV